MSQALREERCLLYAFQFSCTVFQVIVLLPHLYFIPFPRSAAITDALDRAMRQLIMYRGVFEIDNATPPKKGAKRSFNFFCSRISKLFYLLNPGGSSFVELAIYVNPETGARLPVALKFCETVEAAVNTARIVRMLDPAFVVDLVDLPRPTEAPGLPDVTPQAVGLHEGVTFLDDGEAPRHQGFPYVLVMLAGDNTLQEILNQYRKVRVK